MYFTPSSDVHQHIFVVWRLQEADGRSGGQVLQLPFIWVYLRSVSPACHWVSARMWGMRTWRSCRGVSIAYAPPAHFILASYCVCVCDLARAYLSPEIIIFDSACKLGSETGGNARMAAVTRVSLVVKLHDITCS